MINSYDDYPLKPKFEVSENAFKITLPNKNAISRKDLLSDQEQVVIDQIEKSTKISRKEVEKVLQISQTMSGRFLKQLTNKGLIEKVGKGKNTAYSLVK